MFKLDNAIQNWKQKLRSNPAFEDGDIAELESHLREEVEKLRGEGFSEEEAFNCASEEIGEPEPIGEELHKTRLVTANNRPSWKGSSYFLALLPNYLKTSFRNIKKRFGYSLINIFGLTVGLATSLLLLFFVLDELSYDTMHQDADRIYRIVTSTSSDGTPTNANGIFGTGPALKNDFPDEVEQYGRLRRTVHNSKMYVAYENEKFYEDRFFFADPGFLRLFNFHLLKGDLNTVLTQPNTILLTRSTAQKYFGDEEPLGKTIKADPYQDGNIMEFEVRGILEDVPHNSHIQFDFLASYESQIDGDLTRLGGIEGHHTYIKLAESVNPTGFENKLDDFLIRNWIEDPWYSNSLQPLLDIHLHSRLKSEIEANGNIAYIYTFSAIAALILIIACINFINLATARSTERAKEVGLRKAIGAHRNQLMGQFIGESVMMTLLAGMLAVLMVYLLIPEFNMLTKKELSLSGFLASEYMMLYISFLGILGLLTGIYPAVILSSYKSSDVLKANSNTAVSGVLLRKVLVVFQFAVSAALIASTVIVYQQVDYIGNIPLGYARDQILTIPLNPEARDHFDVIRSELEQHSGILSVSGSSHVPTSGTSHNSYKISGIDDDLSFARYYVDEQFLETYGLKLIAGNNISRGLSPGGGEGDFMVSSLAVEEAGLDSPEEIIGRTVQWDEFTGPVTGVVNDMILYDLRKQPYSIIFVITPVKFHKYISVKINTSQTGEVLAHLNNVWEQQVASYPLEYSFLDDKFEQMHASDQKMAETIVYFAILAIIIACLGLFGLTAYTAQRKTKEIGVRKVLGASIPQIIGLLSKDFMKLVFISVLFGLPVAYLGINSWLQDFAFKIEIQPSVFLYSCLIVLVIAFLTISYQTYKVARLNPVNSLKSE